MLELPQALRASIVWESAVIHAVWLLIDAPDQNVVRR